MATKNSQDGIPSNQPEDSGEALGKQDTTVINPPPPGEEIAVFVGDSANLQLRFEPTAVQVTQIDSDLLLRFPNGGQVALRSFDEENGNAPQIVLPDGTPIDGDDLLQQLQALPPLETAAGPEGNSGNPSSGGGGTSVYQSDFGDLLFSLTGNTDGGGVEDTADGGNAGVSTPGTPTPPAEGSDETRTTEEAFLALRSGDPGPAPQTQPAVFVPPVNPVGPGADQALFSNSADNIDLNAIDVGGYQDGTQYDAGRGNDSVVLPGNAREALEAGFTEGTLFDAGRGNDLVTGGSLADLVDGDRGHDTLLGGAGDDTLLGGNNNDSLVGGADDDLLDGGRNNDILLGGAGDDTLIGGHGRDTLEGDEGRDLLSGGGGHDMLLGGVGDDTLTGGGGRDTLEGGDGQDILLGGNSNDSLLGGAEADILSGGSGRDTLDGGLGNDFLDGGSSNDLLLGGAGDDTLVGGSGNGRDTLEGGLGNDVMEGGNGRDVFSFSLAENQGDDLILDFKTGNGGDRLELTDLLDVNSDNNIDIADLDAGGHTVSGTADSVVITFEQGGSLTLDGIDGSSVDSFQDLLDIKVNIDIS